MIRNGKTSNHLQLMIGEMDTNLPTHPIEIYPAYDLNQVTEKSLGGYGPSSDIMDVAFYRMGT